jgi:hypothetical protein
MVYYSLKNYLNLEYFSLLGRPGLPGLKGEMGDWFKGINGKFVFNKNLLYLTSIIGPRGEHGLPGLPGLPGAAGLRGLVSRMIYFIFRKKLICICIYLFSLVFLVPLDYEDNQVLLDFQVN